jgi:hypothetical protein
MAGAGSGRGLMLTWILFWLTVVLIPFALWLHHPVPPFPWHYRGPVKTSRAWLFGLLVILLRFLGQLPAIVSIGIGPPPIDLTPATWLLLTLAMFLVAEVALALLHHAWMDRATGIDRLQRRSVRVLGPAYFLGLVAESTAIGTLLDFT